ncbi:hypothetical protein ACSBR1_015550 [Camellia fascicularis]
MLLGSQLLMASSPLTLHGTFGEVGGLLFMDLDLFGSLIKFLGLASLSGLSFMRDSLNTEDRLARFGTEDVAMVVGKTMAIFLQLFLF